MLYRNTSVKKVIAKVFADLNLQEGEHRISDFIEWAGEALIKIGAFPSFINKVTGKDDVPPLIISDYTAKLPHDFYNLIQVVYSENQNGPYYPMRYATTSFSYKGGSSSTTASASDSDIVTLAMSLYDLTYEQALSKINTEPETKEMLTAMLTTSKSAKSGENIDTTTDYTYIINSGYIRTNVKSGYLMLAYQAIPIDSEGYPLIPDNESFREAIYWYIVMKLTYPEWRAGKVRDVVYYDTRRSWNYYSKQAYGNAMMPNKDQIESIKNAWLRLIPNIKEHDTGFSTLGERQIVYNN